MSTQTSTRVAGEPDRLEAYTEATQKTIGPVRDSLDDYKAAINALLSAVPNDFGTAGVGDRGRRLASILDGLAELDAKPAAFAFALRQLDRSGAQALSTLDTRMFHALAKARQDMPFAAPEDVHNHALQIMAGQPAAHIQLTDPSRRVAQADEQAADQIHQDRPLWERISEFAGRLASRIVDTAKRAWNAATGFFINPVKTDTQTGEKITGFVSGAVQTGKKTVDKAVQAGKDFVGWVGRQASKAGNWIINKFNVALNTIVSWLRDKIKTFLEGLARFAERLKEIWEKQIWPAIDRWVDEHADLLKIFSTVLEWVAFGLAVVGVVLLFTPLAPVGAALLVAAGIIGVVTLGIRALLAATGNGSWTDVGIEAAFIIPFGRLLRPFKPLLKRIPWGRFGKWVVKKLNPIWNKIRQFFDDFNKKIKSFRDKLIRRLQAKRLARKLGVPAEQIERLLEAGVSPDEILRLRQALGQEGFVRLMNNGTLGRLLEKGFDPNEVMRLADELGASGLEIVDAQLRHKNISKNQAIDATRIAKRIGATDDVHRLMTSGNHENPEGLRKLLRDIEAEMAEKPPRFNKRRQLEEASLRAGNGHRISIERSNKPPGKADIIDHDTKEAIQLKVQTSGEPKRLAKNVRDGAEQVLGKRGEEPPSGYRKVVDVRIEGEKNNLSSKSREELLEELKRQGITQKELEGVDELRITNEKSKNGPYVFHPSEF